MGTSWTPYGGVDGSPLPFENFQKVKSYGFELTLKYSKQFTNDLKFRSRLNMSRMKNEVINLGETEDVPDRIKREGRPLGAIFGYNALGLFNTQEEITAAYGENHPQVQPGDIHYEDINGDKMIDGNDQTYIANINLPTAVLGWMTDLEYKNWTFAMLWNAGIGGEQKVTGCISQPFIAGGQALEAHKDYWTPDNKDAAYPRIVLNSSWNYYNSDFWIYDMSYLRLKTVELGYNFDKALLGKTKFFDSARLVFSVTNLLTFSKYKEVDPENNTYGGDYSIFFYPQQIVYNFGVRVGF